MTIDSSNAADADAEDTDSDDGENDDPTTLKAELERWKREAKKAFEKRDRQSQRLAELEKKEREQTEKAAREKNDFAQLEKMLRDEHAGTAKELEQLRGQIAEAEKAKRASAFLDAVMAQAGLPADAKVLVEGFMLREERNGDDISPADAVESRAKAMVKKLRSGASHLFQATSLGPKGTPGTSQGADSGDEEPWMRAIKGLSWKRSE